MSICGTLRQRLLGAVTGRAMKQESVWRCCSTVAHGHSGRQGLGVGGWGLGGLRGGGLSCGEGFYQLTLNNLPGGGLKLLPPPWEERRCSKCPSLLGNAVLLDATDRERVSSFCHSCGACVEQTESL